MGVEVILINSRLGIPSMRMKAKVDVVEYQNITKSKSNLGNQRHDPLRPPPVVHF
jgi:hypothetical protein